MNIVVTGSEGFLGKHLCARLLAAGHHVERIDTAPRLVGPSVDVRDTKAVTRMILGFDAVVHLAANTVSTATFYAEPEAVLDVGLRGTMSIIEAARAAGVPDLLVLSSSEVYGEPLTVPTDESEPMKVADPLNPRFSYSVSKIGAEMLALHATGFRKVQVAVPFSIYGPGAKTGHVIPSLIAKARQDGPLEVQGDGTATRAFCFVDDFVNGLVTMMRHAPSGRFHVGNPEEVTIGELARMIAPDKEIVSVDAPAGSPQRRCPSIAKLAEYGYAPKVSLADGLARMMA